ncbi:MAG: hypothetical protein UW30_C0010G0027 [Candidatus Giovannonibacteria bacterium GW2011_GWA2_44_13b]|uniref:Thioredoxin-like fold domain-containing protein n=2 Tax=Candidatus Giovannoniibacteriota TaxID=1752738 RepID=A0A0G1H1M6_9BACT|nr:MAG: hypothetical protein UW30_C0010G0027 [Candidatus Giovannonibacteria bacterium GW2011_GWA2_44_13b]OGF83071.1 MAG: hypothetical protein A2924_02090 [Candidatus Giovannonibacteria bacterium RIFCSPLOWO2_01_FULL_44_16]
MASLQSLSVPGCVECKKFDDWWSKNSPLFPGVKYEKIVMGEDPRWQELVLKYQIMSSPGILVDGELFSSGGVNTAKLTEKLSAIGGSALGGKELGG